jgi:hypothetical protein
MLRLVNVFSVLKIVRLATVIIMDIVYPPMIINLKQTMIIVLNNLIAKQIYNHKKNYQSWTFYIKKEEAMSHINRISPLHKYNFQNQQKIKF